MSSEYHCVPNAIFFYGMVFVLKVCIMISLLGYNLVINDKKMHFTFLCNDPLSIQNIKPTYFC